MDKEKLLNEIYASSFADELEKTPEEDKSLLKDIEKVVIPTVGYGTAGAVGGGVLTKFIPNKSLIDRELKNISYKTFKPKKKY